MRDVDRSHVVSDGCSSGCGAEALCDDEMGGTECQTVASASQHRSSSGCAAAAQLQSVRNQPTVSQCGCGCCVGASIHFTDPHRPSVSVQSICWTRLRSDRTGTPHTTAARTHSVCSTLYPIPAHHTGDETKGSAADAVAGAALAYRAAGYSARAVRLHLVHCTKRCTLAVFQPLSSSDGTAPAPLPCICCRDAVSTSGRANDCRCASAAREGTVGG